MRPGAAPDTATVPGILHVDMDAFYAAVEVLEDPTLAGLPVVVGGTGRRGVVAAASYEARARGVHSAMPSGEARRRCPEAIFLPGRHSLYGEYSRRIHEVFTRFTPLVEGIALDEAFLDVHGAQRLFGPPDAMAHAIRDRVRDETGLDCSVGVATCKLLAKLASRAAKPRLVGGVVRPGPGVVVVPPGGELAFLHPLPVEALWGVGPATLTKLARLGVRSVGDLAALPEPTLVTGLGPAQGRHLHDLAWGRDDRPVEPHREPKSISHEETYATDHHVHETLRRESVRLADAVGHRLREQRLAARTVTVKIRFADFRTITRSRTLPEAVDSGAVIASVAGELLDGVDPAPGVRLLGIAAAQLSRADAVQLSLEGAGAPGPMAAGSRASVDQAMDAVRAKFGDDAVGPAALLPSTPGASGGLRVKRQGDQQWGPSQSGNAATGDTPTTGRDGPGSTRKRRAGRVVGP